MSQDTLWDLSIVKSSDDQLLKLPKGQSSQAE